MPGDGNQRDGGAESDVAVISALIAGVAHDLANLLMVMGSCTDLLQSSPDVGEPALADAALLAEAVQRASALTERLSSFGRRAARRVSAVDVGGVAGDLDKTLRRLAGEDIAVTVSARSGLIVRADPVRLEQLILTAALGARRLLPRGGQLAVDVADGAGQALVVLTVTPRAGAAASVGPFPALGLIGEIAGEAGGALAVEPLDGGGVRLRVTLPLQDADPAGVAAHPAGGTETVLLVEDDDGTRSILGRVLAAAGYRVLSAAGVAAALRLAEGEQAIALVLTDVVLPDGTGMDVISGVWTRQPGVRVLLASGYPDSVLAGYGVPDRGVSRLTKPFTTAELLAAVRAAIDGPA